MDKINAEIVRVTSKIYEYTAKIKELNEKLGELEKQKIEIENAKIIALFRRENLNEDQFLTLIQETKKATSNNKLSKEVENDDSYDDDKSISDEIDIEAENDI